jgi:hypothetical protein
VKVLDPSIVVPSRETVTRDLDDDYSRAVTTVAALSQLLTVAQIKQEFKANAVNDYAVTSDGWTADGGQQSAFVGLTMHYISSPGNERPWQLHSRDLDLIPSECTIVLSTSSYSLQQRIPPITCSKTCRTP